MKKIFSVLISSFLLAAFFACSKSGSDGNGGGGPLPPPDPGSTGELKAVLSFSNGITHNLNATGNYTLFTKLIDSYHHDTILAVTGGLPGNIGSLKIRLTNIDAPGTYAFITNQTPAPEEGYPQCEFTGNATDEYYSTMQIRTNPGSITIQSISSNYVSGYFNAELTNWYPGRPTPSTTLTISNGSFAGRYTTSSY